MKTAYYDDFLLYYEKAKTLQEINLSSPTGREHGHSPFHDPLMAWIPIYDCVERRYAGFSNAIQQVWWGSANPKKWQTVNLFDDLHDVFEVEDWLWLFLFHRLTGSGASFDQDHGFRNNRVGYLAVLNTGRYGMREAALRLLADGEPCFTSIGNQIPPFPKPVFPYNRGSEVYIAKHSVQLVEFITGYIKEQSMYAPLSIVEVVDLIEAWSRRRGLKMFHFVLTAWVMDIAEYFPHYVDPKSHVNYGKNALESLSLMFDGFKKKNVNDYMNLIMEATGNDEPMSLEDVLCDYVRYIEHYIPKGYIDKLEPWQTRNASTVDHPVKHPSYYKVKGRVDV